MSDTGPQLKLSKIRPSEGRFTRPDDGDNAESTKNRHNHHYDNYKRSSPDYHFMTPLPPPFLRAQTPAHLS